MNIVFCGGAGEVGASCILLTVEGKNILLDSGIRMKTGKDILPDFSSIQEAGGVDAIVVSHAHMDHTGTLPVISREYPEAKIYMTHATKDFVRVLLYDSLKIMKNKESEIPIYAENHVLHMLDRILCFSPNYTIHPFQDKDIRITFYHGGHIAGAVLVYIQSKEGSILYTGDFSVTNQQTVNGAHVPKLRPDVMIMESTYGDKLHGNRSVEEDRLVEKVKETITKGGKILIPAFALGRAQEIILILRRAIHKGILPRCKIYVDGMVKDINRMYKRNPNYLKEGLAKKIFKGNDIFYNENVIAVDTQEIRKEILESKEGLCVISSSGMLTGGYSVYYAEKFAAEEKNYIALTGYQDEEAPGRQILELIDAEEEDKRIMINEKSIPLKCGIGKYGLSAHADKGEMLGTIQKLMPKKLFLVHGDPAIIEELSRSIHQDIRTDVYVPSNGEKHTFHLDHPRKQIEYKQINPLNKGTVPTEENIHELWEYLHLVYQNLQGYTVENLYYIWRGKEDFTEEEIDKLREILNKTQYFKTDTKRLFLYHPEDEETINKLGEESNQVMEMNEMFDLVERLFPKEAGLYKKGANFQDKIVNLYFYFPATAKDSYKECIQILESQSGWKVEINRDCNLMAAEELIHDMLDSSTEVQKISFYREEGYFLLSMHPDIENFQEINEKFEKATGLKLRSNAGGTAQNQRIQTQVIQAVPSTKPRMEQNKAFECIDQCFQYEPHKIYKKSKKEINGVPFIELSFISYAVGERYMDYIKKLEEETGWPIILGNNPNQNEMIKIAKRILQAENIKILKNPSIHVMEEKVKVKTAESVEAAVVERLKQDFFQETGYGLDIL